MKKLLSILLMLLACNQKVLQPPKELPIDTVKVSKRIIPILLSDDTIVLVSQKMNFTLTKTITSTQVDTKIKDATNTLNGQIALLKASKTKDSLLQTQINSNQANQILSLSRTITKLSQVMTDSLMNKRLGFSSKFTIVNGVLDIKQLELY